MYKKTKVLLKIVILSLLTFFALFLIFKDDYKDVITILKLSSPLYIIIALTLMLLVFFIDGLVLTIIANMFKKGYSLKQGIINQQYCNFFNGITPLSSGGQPFQVFLFKKQGFGISNGIGVVLIYFILYKFALLSFAIFAFIYNFKELNILVDQSKYNLLFILIIGFIIIALLSIFIILVTYLPFFTRLFHKIINLLYKIKLIKKVENAHITLDEKIIHIKDNINRIFKNWKILIILILLMFIRFFVLYAIPFVCFYAINCDLGSKYFLDSMSLASYSSIISGIFPAPGGSVGVELAYTYLYKGFFATKLNTLDVDATIKSSLLLWRTITFYLGLILGAIVVLVYKPKKNKEKKANL